MPICPNDGVEVQGSFCPLCGMSVAQMPVQQPVGQQVQPQTGAAPQQYQQPYQQPGMPPARYGPPIGERIGRSPAAKMGVLIAILAIVGLVLSLAIPWISVEKEVGEHYEFVCQDCGYSSEDYFWTCPDCGGTDIDYELVGGKKETFSFNNDLELVDGDDEDWGGDEYTTSNEAEDYLKGSIGLAFLGFIFALILAIALIIIAIMSYTSRQPRSLFHGLGAIIGALLLISGIMIMVSGMNFLGFEIQEMHSDANTEELGGEVTSSTAYPAAYIILIIGIIIFLIALVTARKELRSVQPVQPGTQPVGQPPVQQMAQPPTQPPVQPPMQPQQPQYPQSPGGV